jgi:Domain of unknown function (DUF1841)
MFNPSRDDVRRFFCEVFQRQRDGAPLTPLQAQAARWIDQHPETPALLGEDESARAADFSVDRGQSNPFLHLSMHLALDEQLAIDQPQGIRAVFAAIAARTGDEHTAAHEAFGCLGEILWRSQRASLPADMASINSIYLDCLRRRASR